MKDEAKVALLTSASRILNYFEKRAKVLPCHFCCKYRDSNILVVLQRRIRAIDAATAYCGIL
jgi:hypothetical protein